MEKKVLSTGLTVLYDHRPTESVTLFAQVNVGSNNEPRRMAGISHFLEHMIFEGTKKRKNSVIIANEIERWGGEFNAFTQNDRTCFYIKVLRDYVDIGLDIMADIIQNSIFPNKFVEKERKVIIKEIDMVFDDPRMYQWILANQITFPNHVYGVPIHGSKQSVLATTRKNIMDFYQHFYVPSNMLFAVVGNVPGIIHKIQKKFSKFKRKPVTYAQIAPVAKLQQDMILKQRRNINSAYCVWTWHSYPQKSQLAFAMEVVNAVVGRGQSGTLVDVLRNKHGLAYEVGTLYDCFRDYGYFSVNAAIPKMKLAIAQKAIFQELRKLQSISDQQIQEAKNFIIGKFKVDNEDTLERAEQLCFFEQCGDYRLMEKYVANIRAVKKEDVRLVVSDVLSKHYSLAIIAK